MPKLLVFRSVFEKPYWQMICSPSLILPGPLAIPYSIFGCHKWGKARCGTGIWWVKTWDDAKHPKMSGTAAHLLWTKNYLAKNTNGAEESLRNLAVQIISLWLALDHWSLPLYSFNPSLQPFGSTSYTRVFTSILPLWPCGMQAVSSQTRDWTCTPCSGISTLDCRGSPCLCFITSAVHPFSDSSPPIWITYCSRFLFS